MGKRLNTVRRLKKSILTDSLKVGEIFLAAERFLVCHEFRPADKIHKQISKVPRHTARFGLLPGNAGNGCEDIHPYRRKSQLNDLTLVFEIGSRKSDTPKSELIKSRHDITGIAGVGLYQDTSRSPVYLGTP